MTSNPILNVPGLTSTDKSKKVDLVCLQLQLAQQKAFSILKTTKSVQQSKVWNYYGFLIEEDGTRVDPDNYYCEPCLTQKILKRYGVQTSTDNLSSHLLHKHNVEVTKQNFEKSMRKLDYYFSGASKKATKSSEEEDKKSDKFEFARAISIWFSLDLLPFNEVERRGFQLFCKLTKLVDSRDKIPTHTTVKTTALKDIYDWTHSKVINKLKEITTAVPVTFDAWTDNYHRLSYITFTVHWINKDWEMQQASLQTAYFPRPHSAENVAERLEKVMTEFGLDGKKIIPVTDGGKNMLKACTILNLNRHYCLAHALHNLISKDLLSNISEIEIVLQKIRKIYTTMLYQNDLLLEAFEENKRILLLSILEKTKNIEDLIQSEDLASMDPFEDEGAADMQINNEKMRRLQRDVPTRWNSILIMLESFLASEGTIRLALEKMKKYDLILSLSDVRDCRSLFSVLEVFKTATDVLCGSLYPTMNFILLFRTDILKKLELAKEKNCLMGRASSVILENFQNRFPLTDEIIASALVDPTLKSMAEIGTYLDEKRWTKKHLVCHLLDKYDLSTNPTIQEEAAPVTANMPAWKKAKLDMLANVSPRHTPGSIETEVAKYMLINVPQDVSPLEWWKSHESMFPNIAALAKTLLAIPATSTPSERGFSASGSTITAKRSQIDPLRVKMMLFVHDNCTLILGSLEK